MCIRDRHRRGWLINCIELTAGVRAGDELLIIDGDVIAELDIAYVEWLLSARRTALRLTVRSCQLTPVSSTQAQPSSTLPRLFSHLLDRLYTCRKGVRLNLYVTVDVYLGPFRGAIAVPSVTRCRCCRGHRCAGGVRQWRHSTVATSGEW